MRFVSVLSVESDLERAVPDALGRLDAELGGAAPDLLIAFVSAEHEDSYGRLPELARASRAGTIVGCSAGGVIGAGHEIERNPGVALIGAILPGVHVTTVHLETDALPPLERRDDWTALLRAPAAAADDEPHVLLLADPFTADVERLLAGLDRHFPSGRKVGGLASGGTEPGASALFQGGTLHRSGVVAVTLAGDVALETIVAQGCRPIGEPMFVTGAHGNLLRALDGEPAGRVLRRLYERLEGRDKELFRDSLFMGMVMRESRETYRQGDFLIRNIVGLDAASGSLVIGASLQEGTIVQFHLRDATTSADDLEALLTRHAAAGAPAPAGALLFSCLGRGAHLYGRPDHDSEALRRHVGDVPLGGFFCNGEIGPVQGTTFLHGYTSSFALFSPRPR
jgi:small ligand-binding sensory domain FIST